MSASPLSASPLSASPLSASPLSASAPGRTSEPGEPGAEVTPRGHAGSPAPSAAALFAIAARVSEGEPYPSPEEVALARPVGLAARTALRPLDARAGFESLLPGREVHLSLQYLHEVGLMAAWLPELEATVNFSQEGGRKHKDVWEHTKQVVRQAVPRIEVRWAALLHDIGKVHTRAFTPDGGVTFHRHSEVGARMFDEVARRFAFDRPLHKRVRFLIMHHLRPGQYEGAWTDSAVRRFGRELELFLVDLLDLSRADITSKRPGKRQAALESISELGERIRALRELDAIQPPLPSGIGNVIMERFGLPPSKQIGDLKVALEAAIDEDRLEARREPEYYLAHVAGLLGRELPPVTPASTDPAAVAVVATDSGEAV